MDINWLINLVKVSCLLQDFVQILNYRDTSDVSSIMIFKAKTIFEKSLIVFKSQIAYFSWKTAHIWKQIEKPILSRLVIKLVAESLSSPIWLYDV